MRLFLRDRPGHVSASLDAAPAASEGASRPRFLFVAKARISLEPDNFNNREAHIREKVTPSHPPFRQFPIA